MTAPESTSENKLISDRHKAFVDALEILYIKTNISGRLKFAADWPDASTHIFGEELSRADREGFKDKSRRAALEQEAEDRRIKFLKLCQDIERKSAAGGVLNADYVKDTINALGRNASLYLYSAWIVDKFMPAPATPQPEIKTPPPKATADPAPIQETHSFAMPEAPQAPAPLPTLQPVTPPSMELETILPISLETQQTSPEPIQEKPADIAPPAPEPEIPPQRKRLKLFGIKDAPSDQT